MHTRVHISLYRVAYSHCGISHCLEIHYIVNDQASVITSIRGNANNKSTKIIYVRLSSIFCSYINICAYIYISYL